MPSVRNRKRLLFWGQVVELQQQHARCQCMDQKADVVLQALGRQCGARNAGGTCQGASLVYPSWVPLPGPPSPWQCAGASSKASDGPSHLRDRCISLPGGAEGAGVSSRLLSRVYEAFKLASARTRRLPRFLVARAAHRVAQGVWEARGV